MERLKRTGRHTMLIEHEVDAFVHLVDRVVVLSAEGRVVGDGSPRQVFGERADDLAEHGVWMPRVSLLAHRLRERGARFGPFPVTLDEACLAFRRLAPCGRRRADGAAERTVAGPSTVSVDGIDVSSAPARRTDPAAL